MYGKSVVSRIAPSMTVLVALFLLIAPVRGQAAGERVESGHYWLERSATPESFVAGIDLARVGRARFPGLKTVDLRLRGRWGRVLALYSKEDSRQVKVTAAVYAGVAAAEDAALDLLNDTSARLDRGSRSGDAIGTHSWYLVSPDGSGAVILVYHNCLIQVFSSDYTFAEMGAREIASDLARGSNGVLLGLQPPVLQVKDVVIQDRLLRGQPTRVTLKAEDAAQRTVYFSGRATAGQVLDGAKPEEKILVLDKSGDLELYAVNDLNVVSQVFVRRVKVETEP
jgi:hypothetical protein